MDNIIKVLPDDVAGQIAAGEVVQRPASVVKELLENSVDAHSTRISLFLTDSGRSSIKVIDNGSGISFDDAANAFLPHATSKISQTGDLFSLSTFGFRGEALPSIAAISDVVLKTRRSTDQIGTLVQISGGKVLKHQQDTAPVGTQIEVRNIFFNVPARRKFLKNDSVEYTHILNEFKRVAISHPEIEFELFNQNNAVYQLKASTFKQRIVSIFGDKMNGSLLPVELNTELVSINGFVSRTDTTRQRGYEQFFFVNNRFMKHPYFHKAVMEAYDGLVAEGSQPFYFLNFSVKPDQIDVNIHPTKTEIKFANEREIWQILSSTVNQAIGKFERITEIDFEKDDAPQIPVFSAGNGKQTISPPSVDVDKSYNPFQSCKSGYYSQGKSGENWENLYARYKDKSQQVTSDDCFEDSGKASTELNGIGSVSSYICFQFLSKYIVTPCPEGIMIVDQHRASVLMNYYDFAARIEDCRVCSQRLLFPELFTITPEQAEMLPVAIPLLTACGFELSDMGGGAVSLTGVPSSFLGKNTDYAGRISDLIDLAVSDKDSEMEKRKESFARYLAGQVSIPYGKQLTNSDMSSILDFVFSQIESCTDSCRGIDGKRLYNIISADSIGRLF